MGVGGIQDGESYSHAMLTDPNSVFLSFTLFSEFILPEWFVILCKGLGRSFEDHEVRENRPTLIQSNVIRDNSRAIETVSDSLPAAQSIRGQEASNPQQEQSKTDPFEDTMVKLPYEKAYPIEEAVRAQRALRQLAGLGQEQFPVAAFVGMISDEIETLRKQGRTDQQIADAISQNSSIAITPEDIAANYAPPEQRHPGDHQA